MQTAPPRGAVVVEGTPAWTSTRYEAAFGGSTQPVSSGKAGDEDSQPLLSPPTDTDPPFPPLPPQQWGTGNGYRRLRGDCKVLLDKREEDRVSIAACFDKLFEQHTKDMDRLFEHMEEKDAARQAQIQASFGKIVKLEKELRSAPNAVTTHLDAVVPQAIATVLDQTLPSKLATALQEMISPTLKTVLGDTISDTFVSVMDGTFSVFTTKVELMGMDMVQAVRALVASAEGPLLECYVAVQEECSACKTCLDKVLELLLTRSNLLALAPASHTPPAIPGGDATVPSCPPPLDHGGDASYHAPSADAYSLPVDAHGGVQRHPSFLKGRIKDFNFFHPPERESARSDGSPSCGASATKFHPVWSSFTRLT
jgi:hypothetical protein